VKRYIISIKREGGADVSADWTEPLRGIKDLHIRGTVNPHRIQVDASDAAIAEARRLLSELCHIESAIPHGFA
jgi:hypothetical protein